MNVQLKILSVLIAFTACVKPTSSEVKHEWAKLTRDGSNSMDEKCQLNLFQSLKAWRKN